MHVVLVVICGDDVVDGWVPESHIVRSGLVLAHADAWRL